MAKTSTVRARIDEQIKARAEKILQRTGISTSDAIKMLMHQIILHKGVPFDVRVPNAETIKAMRELDAGLGERFTGSAQEMLDAMEKSLKSVST